MRLVDLKPEFGKLYRDHHLTADNGGIDTGNYWLCFVCPTCALPYSILIQIGATEDRSQPRWAASPMPEEGWLERLTLLPSIDNRRSGHGPRHPTCGFHGEITNGQIVLSQ